MAKVLLLSAAAQGGERALYYARHDLDRLLRSVRRDKFRVHSLTDDPASADAIIFVERGHAAGHGLEHVRQHPYARAYREKCFVCNPRYKGIPFLPGVYASIEKTGHFRQRVRSGHYLEVAEKDHLAYQPGTWDPTYLYSFVGAVDTAPVRSQLAGLSHPRQLFLDTGGEKPRSGAPGGEDEQYRARYVKIIHNSAFVLCPRGIGVSTLRLFESLKMGRAPVIIADGWVAPEGPDWDSFSVRVPEGKVDMIPKILEEKERHAEEMGRLARKAWEDWFSDEASFHRIVEWCLDIKAHRVASENVLRYAAYVHLLRPRHLRRLIGMQVRSAVQGG